jgi:PST family polysaccharide transporter
MKHRAISGGIITSASQVVMFVLRLASIMVLARLIGPEHFGLIGMVTALTVLIEKFEDLGMGDAVVQRREITHEQVSNLFWINMSLCALITVLVALSSKAIAWFYNDQRLVWITVALSSNFIFSGSSIQPMALMRRRMRFGHFAMVRIL